MAVRIEELKEEQIDLHLLRLLKRDWGFERIESYRTARMIADLRRIAHLIETERKKGYSKRLERKKQKLLKDAIRALILRKRALAAELRDIQAELRMLGIEEHEEARLLKGK